eukprot:6046632-Heterocapsa_arctica.AAC.1
MLEPSGVSELFGCPPDHQEQQVGGDASDGIVPPFGAGNGTDDAAADLLAEKLAEDAFDLKGGL